MIGDILRFQLRVLDLLFGHEPTQLDSAEVAFLAAQVDVRSSQHREVPVMILALVSILDCETRALTVVTRRAAELFG